MTEAFTAATTIARPSADVWATITDWEHAHLWMPGVERLESTGESTVGTIITFHARGKGRPTQIVAAEPGQSITLRSTQGGVSAAYTYLLTSVDDSNTDVRLVADCTTSGRTWTLLGPVLRAAIRRTDRHQLDYLKELIEAEQ